MRCQFCSQSLNILLATIILCSLVQVDGKLRRRRQGVLNNYGRYVGNGQQNNPLIVGGTAYRYPTPVNVMNGGSYNPGRYDTYPDRGTDYYSNMNDMRLASSSGWNSPDRFQRHPSMRIFNSAQGHTNISAVIILFAVIFTYLIYDRI